MDRRILKRATLHRKKVTQMCSNFGKLQRAFVVTGATFLQFGGEMAYFRQRGMSPACSRAWCWRGLESRRPAAESRKRDLILGAALA
jgi:hypothetical protein